MWTLRHSHFYTHESSGQQCPCHCEPGLLGYWGFRRQGWSKFSTHQIRCFPTTHSYTKSTSPVDRILLIQYEQRGQLVSIQVAIIEYSRPPKCSSSHQVGFLSLQGWRGRGEGGWCTWGHSCGHCVGTVAQMWKPHWGAHARQTLQQTGICKGTSSGWAVSHNRHYWAKHEAPSGSSVVFHWSTKE
jgi:hypothetical protein